MSVKRGKRLSLICAGFMLGALGVSGCRTGGGGGGDAVVRLINASPDTDELAVAVNGQRVFRHSLFRSNTGYAGVGQGTYKMAVEARRGSRLLDGTAYLDCLKGKAYTVVALGRSAGAPDLRIFSEDASVSVPGDRARVRFVNAAQGDAATVDVLFNNIAGLTDIAYGSRSGAALLEPGAYDVRINTAGEAITLVGPTSVRLRGGHAYTLVAMGRADAVNPQQSLSLELFPDDRPDTGE